MLLKLIFLCQIVENVDILPKLGEVQRPAFKRIVNTPQDILALPNVLHRQEDILSFLAIASPAGGGAAAAGTPNQAKASRAGGKMAAAAPVAAAAVSPMSNKKIAAASAANRETAPVPKKRKVALEAGDQFC